MYAIRIDKTGRYIQWCNSHWYGTQKEPLYQYTEEECKEVFAQMNSHYTYAATMVDENGKETPLNVFKKADNVVTKVIKGLKKLPTITLRGKNPFTVNLGKIDLSKIKLK